MKKKNYLTDVSIRDRQLFLAGDGVEDIWEGCQNLTHLKRGGTTNSVHFGKGV